MLGDEQITTKTYRLVGQKKPSLGQSVFLNKSSWLRCRDTNYQHTMAPSKIAGNAMLGEPVDLPKPPTSEQGRCEQCFPRCGRLRNLRYKCVIREEDHIAGVRERNHRNGRGRGGLVDKRGIGPIFMRFVVGGSAELSANKTTRFEDGNAWNSRRRQGARTREIKCEIS